mmetsp:Transcript_26114/g.72892  ORF Transcript_26114/g.72892 Transcript_26114/m.72892 type:complete len:280 (+) Transcript_26114:349-1188(+)
MLFKTLESRSFTIDMFRSSFSVAATEDISSQTTPIKRFINVIAERQTKRKNTTAHTMLCLPILRMTGPKSSRNTPSTSSTNIPSGTDGKKSWPIWVSSLSWRRQMANTYATPTIRIPARKTDRMEAITPRTIVINSGRACSKRAILITRTSLRSLTMRRSEAFPRSAVWDPLIMISTSDITHVSMTIKNTRTESNTIHMSRGQFHFDSNAMKRISHSEKKYKQNKFSPTRKPGGMSSTEVPVLKSVSIQIQIEFTTMTLSVIFSNTGLRAMACQQPSVR